MGAIMGYRRRGDPVNRPGGSGGRFFISLRFYGNALSIGMHPIGQIPNRRAPSPSLYGLIPGGLLSRHGALAAGATNHAVFELLTGGLASA